jgi:hypothetical protein
MRVAVIVVAILLVATPSEASKSCMSKTEARQHFGAVHIYWHGADHCWDASPTSQHRQIQARRKILSQEIQRKSEPKWRQSMSQMLRDDEATPPPGASTLSNVEYRENDDAVTGTPWADRWVIIEPSQSPIIARRVHVVQVSSTPVIEHKSELMVSPHDVVVLAFIALILTLGTIEAVYRNEP